MDWLLLTFISVAFRSVYGVMTKVLSNRVKASVYTQGALLSLAGAAVALVLSPLLGGLHFDFAHVSILAIILVALGQGLGNIVYFAAIKNLTNGTAQIAFSSILLFNTVLSLVFLNLHLSVLNVFGLVLLMLAILSVVNGKVEFHRKGAALMVLSAFLFSVFQLSSAEMSKQVGAATYLIVAYLGSVLVITLLKGPVIVRDVMSSSKRLTLGLPLITALPSLGNFLFAYYAYRTAPEAPKVAMLLTSQVVLTVFLSYIFLKERGNLLRKVVAAALVVMSAALIKL